MAEGTQDEPRHTRDPQYDVFRITDGAGGWELIGEAVLKP